MDISARTVMIVGGTSGIGLGLARRFATAGSTVIVGGRNTGRVDDLETVEIDVTDPESILRGRDEVLTHHPDLDVVVTMSGVMFAEDLQKVNPAALPLESFLDEVIELVAVNPTSNEILVKGVYQHRWAERHGTYAELVERRSQSLNTLPGR
jgi:short-subunit dehydrogenase involved in D-alanine esterification of teichoic acids